VDVFAKRLTTPFNIYKNVKERARPVHPMTNRPTSKQRPSTGWLNSGGNGGKVAAARHSAVPEASDDFRKTNK